MCPKNKAFHGVIRRSVALRDHGNAAISYAVQIPNVRLAYFDDQNSFHEEMSHDIFSGKRVCTLLFACSDKRGQRVHEVQMCDPKCLAQCAVSYRCAS